MQKLIGLGSGLAIAIGPTVAGAVEPLEQARQYYALTVADLERQCADPKTLNVETYTDPDEVEMVSFTCWSPADATGVLTGQWLGRLPLSPIAAFGASLTCRPEDELCHHWLPTLRSQYPLPLQQAEFHCAMRDGVLLTEFTETTVAIRCGFFATTLWDENGDNLADYEDQISVDIPLTALPLLE